MAWKPKQPPANNPRQRWMPRDNSWLTPDTPPEGKPQWIVALSDLVPLHHYFEITMGIFPKGAGVDILWREILWLAALGCGIFAIGDGRSDVSSTSRTRF